MVLILPLKALRHSSCYTFSWNRARKSDALDFFRTWSAAAMDCGERRF